MVLLVLNVSMVLLGSSGWFLGCC